MIFASFDILLKRSMRFRDLEVYRGEVPHHSIRGNLVRFLRLAETGALHESGTGETG